MAGQPTIAANAPVNPMSEMAMVMQGYSPQTAVAAQHSQYLAQALAEMGQQSQNIRTPVALAGDLLAETLLRRKYGQSMQDFASAAAGDRARFGQDLFGGLRADDATPPAASPDVDGSGAQIPPPPAPPPVGGSAPPQVAQFSPAVLRAIYGEDTHNPADQQAIAGVILRRAAMSGMTPDQVVATGGFEGAHNKWAQGATDADLQKVAANVSGAQPGPYDAFYSPGAQAALGRSPPAWDNGHGVDVGGNRFFGGVYAPPPSANPGVSMPGQPGPVQTANSGQNATTPSPSPSASVSSAPGGPASAPAAASPAAGASAGLPEMPSTLYAPVNAQEIEQARKFYANPMSRQQGVALAIQLRERQNTPIQPKMDPVAGGVVLSDPYGRYAPKFIPVQGLQYGAPQEVPGVAGRFQQGPNGQLTKIGDAPFGAPGQTAGVQGVTQVGPDGQVHVVGQPALPAERVLEMRHQFFDSDEYKKFAEARSALTGFRSAVGQIAGANNGVLDTAALDSYLRGINPGASARNTTVSMFLEHLGLPQEIQGAVLSATGNGYLTPQTLQQMDRVMQAYTAAHGAEVQKLAGADASLAKGYGLDQSALGENFGDIPQPTTLNFGGAPGAGPAGASAQQTLRTVAGSVANAAANLPRLSPQQAAALPPGTRFVGLDGRERVRK